MNMRGLERPTSRMTFAQRGARILFGALVVMGLLWAVGFILQLVKSAVPGLTFPAVIAIVGAAYIVLVGYAARFPDLEMDDPNAPIDSLPKAGEVAPTGLYYLLPIVILIWCILIERLSPTLSAFWATMAMITVALTQRPLKAMFRNTGELSAEFARGVQDWIDGMVAGARNMIGIGVATAAAGIIVGTISLTGAHQVVGEFVEFLSGGNLMVMLFLVAVMSLILGMGLPTTANYIVVSSLMAPVIVSLGAQSGLIVPLIAVHLFVFYFGILADDTPPVGLAAFAAAAISGGDPIKTGVQGFAYDIRTALLPFLFIFNTELLLIDVGPMKAIFVFVVAVIAMMLFAAATQGYFFARSRIYESLILLAVAFTLFRPGFWLDMVQPPFDERSGTEVVEIASQQPADTQIRVTIAGPDFDDADVTKETTIVIDLGAAGDGEGRLSANGIVVNEDNGLAVMDEPFPGTPLAELGQAYDFYADNPVVVQTVGLEAERMPKELFYIPALLVLAGVIALQRRRQTVPAF